jgi:DNA-directed RNA polymerase subunit RPC12/RpoP
VEESIQATDELRCLECRREWADPAERWRLYVTHDDEAIQGLYCPGCASFEFDD